MTAALRAGVIGLGAMGRHHVRIMREMDGVDLVAVADPAGDRFGVAGDLPVGESVDDLVAAGVDMAVVAVPTAYHETVAVALARAGVATMVEKPLAVSSEAARAVETAFAQAGVFACVGHVERFNSSLSELKKRLDAGELGEIYQVATRRQSPFPGRIADVGVVKDLAVHDIDITRWLCGSDYVTVAAQAAYESGREFEDMVAMTCKLADGVLTNHLINWLCPTKERITAVTGARGMFVADSGNVTLTLLSNGSVATEWEPLRQFRGVTEGDVVQYAIATKEPLKSEDEAFRDAVLGIRDDTVSLVDGVKTLIVAEAALESAARGQAIQLER